MDGNGGEKRKADEMASDSVEVPLEELREVAEKAGEEAEKASKVFHGHCVFLALLPHVLHRRPFPKLSQAQSSLCCRHSRSYTQRERSGAYTIGSGMR